MHITYVVYNIKTYPLSDTNHTHTRVLHHASNRDGQ